MDTNIDNLKKFIESIRSIEVWVRIFGWQRIKNQLIDATADLERLVANYENERGRTSLAVQNAVDLVKDIEIAKEDGRKKQSEIDRLLLKTGEDATKILSLSTEISSTSTSLKNEFEKNTGLSHKNDLLAQQLENKQMELKKATDQALLHEADRERQGQEHREEMATLKQYQDRIQAERDMEKQEINSAELKRVKNLKDTWIQHQETVKHTMKALCSRHTIDYVDKVAFKGDPDNTVSVCGEFIVFDAKSPRGEDLSNFPIYIKDQAEKAKKYANQENVKKWIFFVVPANSLEVIKTFVCHLADYQVFIVTIDAIEPILLSLKKVEEYEFANQLNPEERENICRILGKFAHLSKRRIQIDTFFINQFMELAYKCESDLPSDVLEKAIEFERAEKLNPPQEKRSKAIPMADLEKSLTKIKNDAGNKGISLEHGNLTDGLNGVPLYSPG